MFAKIVRTSRRQRQSSCYVPCILCFLWWT